MSEPTSKTTVAEHESNLAEPIQRSNDIIVVKLSTHTWIGITTMTMGLFLVSIIWISILNSRGHKVDADAVWYSSTIFFVACVILYLWTIISVFRSESHAGHK